MGAPTYDPFNPACKRDPYPSYAELRRDAPVFHVAARDMWAVSRHADVSFALKRPDLFSSSINADRAEIPFAALLDEPFVALPVAAGPLRDFWLALDARPGSALIAAEATAADEVLELVSAGVGVALIAKEPLATIERNIYPTQLLLDEICARHNDVATASLIEVWIDESERRTWFLSEIVRDL